MHEHLAKLVTFSEELSDESDRGCAILAVSLLEERLRESLKIRLACDDEQLNQFVPPGAVGRGVTLAKLVGLISSEWEADWKLVLKIRNAFAHKVLAEISFDTEPVAPWLRDFKIVPDTPGQSNRTRFLWEASALYGLLAWLTLQAGAISKPVVAGWYASEEDRARRGIK